MPEQEPYKQTSTARKAGIMPFDQVPRWLMALAISPGAKIVYAYLHRKALQCNGDVYPKLETIANHTGIARSGIQRHIITLQNIGAIQYHPQRKRDHKQSSNRFFVMFNSPSDLEIRLKRHGIKLPDSQEPNTGT